MLANCAGVLFVFTLSLPSPTPHQTEIKLQKKGDADNLVGAAKILNNFGFIIHSDGDFDRAVSVYEVLRSHFYFLMSLTPFFLLPGVITDLSEYIAKKASCHCSLP